MGKIFMEVGNHCLFELEPSWHAALEEELAKPYITSLAAFVERERALSQVPIYPPKPLVFNALSKTPFPQVKVVIIGQDPYHGAGQAHGLSFSVPVGISPPPSLQNIFKELHTDLGLPLPTHGCLDTWAEQGVLLLNATLTVRQGEPMSHHGKGWEQFTSEIVSVLSERQDPLIFVLWGKSAQEKGRLIQNQKKSPHAILTASHPSPFSAHQGFFGSRPFSKINALLESYGKKPINWRL